MNGETRTIEPTEVIIARHPCLEIVAGKEITGADGKLIFDLHQLLSDHGSRSSVIIATPNVPLAQLGALRQELRGIVGADRSLDLNISVYDLLDGDVGQIKTHWNLGGDGGDRVSVHIYPKEFFDSSPDVLQVFDQKIVPSIFSRS